MRGGQRGLLATAVLLIGGATLAGCGAQSASLGHQACVEVASSLRLYAASGHATGAEQRSLVNRANVALRVAGEKAALAASSDTDWQALEATLSESSHLPEGDLVHALHAQCKQTLS